MQPREGPFKSEYYYAVSVVEEAGTIEMKQPNAVEYELSCLYSVKEETNVTEWVVGIPARM